MDTDLFFEYRTINEESEDYLPIEGSLLRAETEISKETAYLSKVEVSFVACEDFSGVITIGIKGSDLVDPRAKFFLPGFMYGTNRGDAPLVVDSKSPCMRMAEEYPASPWWMVRSDRLSHPVALMYSAGLVTGISATPYFVISDDCKNEWFPGVSGEFCQYCGFGCSLDRGTVYYTLGYENAPRFFLNSHTSTPRAPLANNCFKISKGETVSVTLFLYKYKASDERDIQIAIKDTYERFHEAPKNKRNVSETVSDLSTAIMKDAWLPGTHSYAGFVFDKGDHYEVRELPSISWTNGLSTAVPMLASAHRLNNEEMRTQALECIDHIVATSLNEENSLPYMSEPDGSWSNRGWWYDRLRTPGHAAYLVGQSVYHILRAYALEKEHGHIHEDYLEYARKVIAVTEKSRNTDGEYPYVFSEKTGAGLEYDSFSSSWCMAAAAYYSYLTGEKQYLENLYKSAKWYHTNYIKKEVCYGGPLDIDKNVDSEGILAYIRAVHYLCEIFNDNRREELLEDMRDGLYYEFSFKFCYNSPIKVPPLSKVGWSSSGGSITSVTNPHIHPMSSSIIDEMFFYLDYRDDPYVQSRLKDTVIWSCQCHNTFDGEFDYGKIGWMSERFCHCEGLLTETYPDGSPASTWFALMPWASGSILEGLTGKIWELNL